jgi:hypothetical protein
LSENKPAGNFPEFLFSTSAPARRHHVVRRNQQRAFSVAAIRPEVTGRKRSAAATGAPGIGHNGGPPLDPIEWHRVIDLKEVCRLTGLSLDTLKRHHSKNIITLSPRRRGMKLGIALSLSV